jgi:hypothetical protein
MLLPIGNRKVETCRGVAFLNCAEPTDNLLLTVNVLNAPESPNSLAISLASIWGAHPHCSNLVALADTLADFCGISWLFCWHC